MKTVQISGKEYVTVNERLKFFREKYPTFSLRTELIKVDAESALIKAIISDPSGHILAEGTSFEVAGSSFINKTSHVENAETSAWGRALGNFGIGIDASVATADEVANAVANQGKKAFQPKSLPLFRLGDATPLQLKEIEDLAKELGGTKEKVYEAYTAGKSPTGAQAISILAVLHKKKYDLSKEIDSSL